MAGRGTAKFLSVRITVLGKAAVGHHPARFSPAATEIIVATENAANHLGIVGMIPVSDRSSQLIRYAGPGVSAFRYQSHSLRSSSEIHW